MIAVLSAAHSATTKSPHSSDQPQQKRMKLLSPPFFWHTFDVFSVFSFVTILQLSSCWIWTWDTVTRHKTALLSRLIKYKQRNQQQVWPAAVQMHARKLQFLKLLIAIRCTRLTVNFKWNVACCLHKKNLRPHSTFYYVIPYSELDFFCNH